MDERDLRAEAGGSYGSGTLGPDVGTAVPATITIHLGVIDAPYANRAQQKVPKAKKGRQAKPIQREANTQTTGDVAEILEGKYGIMQTFAEVKEAEILDFVQASLSDALENLMAGGPAGNPFSQGEADIETMFKNFIISQEVETASIPGVPTQAALDGVNHRLKHPYAKDNQRRPSFDDTGLYVQNFKCWIE
jgi:hypothetical protein